MSLRGAMTPLVPSSMVSVHTHTIILQLALHNIFWHSVFKFLINLMIPSHIFVLMHLWGYLLAIFMNDD